MLQHNPDHPISPSLPAADTSPAELRASSPDRPDADLLDEFILHKDAAAFELLVRRHGPMVLGVCRRVLHNSTDAEDAFQATFLVLMRKAGSIRPRRMVGSWLNGVAYRTALKSRSMRQRVRRRETHLDATNEPRQDDSVPLWNRLEPLLDAEMSRLPEKYRLPLILCDLEGRSGKQAAHLLGWPEGTVSGRLFRARALLRTRLARLGLTVTVAALAETVAEQAASGAVPPALIASTTNGAAVAASGTAAQLSGAFPDRVAALAKGVVKSMLAAKIKVAAAALLVTAALGAGAAALAVSARHSQGPAPEEALAAKQQAEQTALAAHIAAEREAMAKGGGDRRARSPDGNPDQELAAKLEAEAKETEAKRRSPDRPATL